MDVTNGCCWILLCHGWAQKEHSGSECHSWQGEMALPSTAVPALFKQLWEPSARGTTGGHCWWGGWGHWALLRLVWPRCAAVEQKEDTPVRGFLEKKTTDLIMWNNHLKLLNEERRTKSAHRGGKKELYKFCSTAKCWFTVIPFISVLIKHLLKDQACQCDLRPIAWSVKWGKLPDLLVMIESF